MLALYMLFALFFLFLIYFAIVYRLLQKEVLPKMYREHPTRDELIEKYPDLESIYQAENLLDLDPGNINTRADILGATLLRLEEYPKKKKLEHALWFLRNAPFHHVVFDEVQYTFLQNGENEEENKRGIQEAVDIWNSHLAKDPDNWFLLNAAVKNLTSLHYSKARELQRKLVSEYPFSSSNLDNLAFLESCELPPGYRYIHPNPYLKRTFHLEMTILHRPWTDSMSERMAQLRYKYGRVLFPNILCFAVLYIVGFKNWQSRPWNDYYFISKLGMHAYQTGDYKFAAKCAEHFAKIAPAARKNHNHAPLFFTGYSLQAISALHNKNYDLLNKLLAEMAQDKIESHFDYHNDMNLLIELLRTGHRDIAVQYMKNRASDALDNPDILKDIAYVENGGNIYSKAHYDEMRDEYEREKANE